MTEFTIERASPAALAACFALLPNLASPDAVLFAARDADGTLAGAGGVLWRSWGEPAGMPAWITVLPDRRRRGIGSGLIAVLAAAAREERLDLIMIDPVDDASDAAAFAQACGAQVDRRQLFFEADARDFIASIDPLARRLAARGRVPDEARIVALKDAPIDEVKWLVAQEMATAPPMVAQLLAQDQTSAAGQAPIDPDRSCVLMVGDTVAGALLSRRLPDRVASAIVCNVVAPAWRGGWANVLLLRQFTQRTIDAGCFRIGFDCGDDVIDTIGLARRSKADSIAVKTRFRYQAVATDAAERRR